MGGLKLVVGLWVAFLVAREAGIDVLAWLAGAIFLVKMFSKYWTRPWE